MFKLAGKVFDAYDDHSRTGRTIAQRAGLPTSDEIAALPDRDFALVVKTASGVQRRYPLATANLVKAAQLYFEAYGDRLPQRARSITAWRIKAAADKFNLGSIGSVTATVQADPPEEAQRTGVVHEQDLMPDETTSALWHGRRLDKVAAALEVQELFLSNYDRMTPAERAVAAHHITKLGEVTDPRVYDYVPKSRFGPKLAEGLRQRRTLVRDDVVKTAQLHELMKTFLSVGPAQSAILLNQFDKQAQIEERVLDAFVTCWGGFTKSAACFDPTSAKHHKLTALSTEHIGSVRSVLDQEITDAFSRDPLGYYERALPKVKRVLDHLMAAIGSPPKRSVHGTAGNRHSMRYAKNSISAKTTSKVTYPWATV